LVVKVAQDRTSPAPSPWEVPEKLGRYRDMGQGVEEEEGEEEDEKKLMKKKWRKGKEKEEVLE
jgi:hypothetical protein